MASPARAEDCRSIDHVGNPGHAAELTSFTSSLVVERLDLDFLGSEQARQTRLSTSVPPSLADDTGGDRQ